MPSQPLESTFDTLRARLQAELDAQLSAIQAHHAQAVSDARPAQPADERVTYRMLTREADWALIPLSGAASGKSRMQSGATPSPTTI